MPERSHQQGGLYFPSQPDSLSPQPERNALKLDPPTSDGPKAGNVLVAPTDMSAKFGRVICNSLPTTTVANSRLSSRRAVSMPFQPANGTYFQPRRRAPRNSRASQARPPTIPWLPMSAEPARKGLTRRRLALLLGALSLTSPTSMPCSPSQP